METTDCISCKEEMPLNECKNSKLDCGHHCNCSWIHDKCCWCGEKFEGDEGDEETQFISHISEIA